MGSRLHALKQLRNEKHPREKGGERRGQFTGYPLGSLENENLLQKPLQQEPTPIFQSKQKGIELFYS